jgi:uncharacterized protein (TIRG00374 family)
MEEAKNNKKLSAGKILLYVFYALLTIGLLFLILGMNDIGQIWNEVANCKVEYLILALIACLIYLALFPISLVLLGKAEKAECKARDIYNIGMTEHFFNGITPFATGGQPFQIYGLTRKGVKASKATGILMMNFVLFMIVTNAFALLSLIYFTSFAVNDSMIVISIIGFTMNFLVVIFIILISSCKKLGKSLVKLMKLIGKIKFLTKIIDKNVVKFEEYINQTQTAFKDLWRHKKACLVCVLTKIVTMFVYYGITFFVLKAINVEVGFDQIFFIVCATSFAITAVVFMPTPGSAGGIEFAFTNIFQSALLITAVESASGMLIWRLITFYFVMTISLLFYIIFEIRLRKEQKKLNSQTLANEPEVNEEQK